MFLRFVSSTLLLPLLLLLHIGNTPLYILQSIVIFLALGEFFKAFENIDIHCIKITKYILPLITLFINFNKLNIHIILLSIFILFMICFILVLLKKYTIVDLAITFIGIIYIVICLNYVILIRNDLSNGILYMWLIFICSFSTDISAYLSGYFFGKNKLNSEISPSKTIEGSLGGILGCVICCLIYSSIFNLNMHLIFIISTFGSIVAQLGDLFASSIKRYTGVKDFGSLIPGHGGILDRLDSILFVAPYIYYCIFIWLY